MHLGIFLPERGGDGLIRAEVWRFGAADDVGGGRDGLRFAGAAGALPPAALVPAVVQPGCGSALERHGVEVQTGDSCIRRAKIQIVLLDTGCGMNAIGTVVPLVEGVGLEVLLTPAFMSFISRGGRKCFTG